MLTERSGEERPYNKKLQKYFFIMAISANTLFHFTSTYDILIKILQSRFFPRLCLEKGLWHPGDMKWAIPMVCFCDIPLSNIADHTKKYGNYAIGLKKTWAIEQGVSPILYVHDNTPFVLQALSALKWSLELSQKDAENLQERLAEVMSMFFMMKPYEGYQERGGKREKIRFYDEREWRYLPPIGGQHINFLTEEKFKDKAQRERLNSFNEQYGVNFYPDVINYIIVEKEEEIVSLMHKLHSIKGDFSYNSVELLSSRIISMDRIREDF